MNPKPKILIVDDRVENLVTLERILADIDATIMKATSGNDALTILLQHEFALLLIDVEMPEMDGFETVELMRQDKKNKYLPAIFISAIYSEDYHLIKGVESGAVDFITKPLIPQILKGKVKIFLEIYEQRKKLQRYAEAFKLNNSELLYSNNRLKESELNLKKSNDNKDKVFSIIAHDLKNPFNSLIGYSDLIMDKLEDLSEDERQVILTGINNIAKQTYNLLETLLNWSKVQVGKQDAQPVNLNLREVVNKIIDFLSPIASFKEVVLHNKVLPSVTIFADPNVISTIIRNLVTNSIKFCNSGDWININCELDFAEIKITIEDSGVGIEPENLETLFLVDKVHSERGTCNEKGSGLGLILCKDLIERNNGYICAESEPGKGSKFTISLPKTKSFKPVL